MLYEIWLCKTDNRQSNIRLGIYHHYPISEFIDIIQRYKDRRYSASQYKKGLCTLYFQNGEEFGQLEIIQSRGV